MSTLHQWSTVTNKVENANIQHHQIQKQINITNKRAYKQQLDRQIQYKQYQNAIKSSQKIQQLREAKSLAEQQKLSRLRQKQQSAQLHKLYCDDNRSLLQTRTVIKHRDSNMRAVDQHPFIKLVDGQETREMKLKQKFIKQNQINLMQEQMKIQQKYKNKRNQWQEKNNFINHVEKTHERRSEQREKFKNKYLRIQQTFVDPLNNSLENGQQSLQKSYITYLNNQIMSNNERKKQEKSSMIDDPRLNQFYKSDKLEPDSSPAFLGRNPLSYERRRQLYYISKNLGTNHERASTVGLEDGNVKVGGSNGKRVGNDNDGRKSMEFVKMAKRLNPEDDTTSVYQQSPHHHMRKEHNNSESVHMRQHSTANRHYKMQTQAKEKRHYLSSERDPISSNSLATDQSRFHSNKRIKSQLVENIHSNYQGGLPDISMQSHHKISSSVKIPLLSNQRKSANLKRQRRQFFRYDPITGKQVAVFV